MQFFTIVGIVLYFLFVTKCSFSFLKVKYVGLLKLFKKSVPFLIKMLVVVKLTISLLSVDYIFAKKVKGQLAKADRAKIIQERNKSNFIVSRTFMVCSFLVILFDLDVLTYLFSGFNGYRFISRSLEITFAFSFDSFNENDNKSGLNKLERISLAIHSYLEIYVYSASFYVTIIHNSAGFSLILKSLLASLSVGTLTNIGYIQNEILLPSELSQLLVFFQVFATLSLVVLSLAMYVSRKH